jgi:hypothetical protein
MLSKLTLALRLSKKCHANCRFSFPTGIEKTENNTKQAKEAHKKDAGTGFCH